MLAKLNAFLIALVFVSISIASAEVTIRGIVLNEEKRPIAGATIKVTGTKSISITRFDGKFSITCPSFKSSITISSLGFETAEIKLGKDSLNMVIILKSKLDKSKKDMPYTEGTYFDEEDDIKPSPSKPGSVTRGKKESERSTGAAEGYGETSHAFYKYSSSVEEAYGGEDGSSSKISSVYEATPEVSGLMADEVTSSGKAVYQAQAATEGMLTAGEINDFSKWILWQDISENDLKEWKTLWKIYPKDRFTLQLETENKYPVIDAKVFLYEGENIIWASRTDNTGKAELWGNAFASNIKDEDDLTLKVEYAGKTFEFDDIKKFHDGINIKKIPVAFTPSKKADIVFVVDATGSMQDEIDYLKADLNNIITGVKDSLPNLELNLGCIFYRDSYDSYLTKHVDLNSDISKATEFIKANNAGGGGDYPEAVHSALELAINKLSWRDETVTKIIFLVLDAPPHQEEDVINQLDILIEAASSKGIRIVPVTCSGVDKSTEFLMRSMALLTNGTYTFLTDDSGIGDTHIKPTTDKWEVEKLNDLIKRVIFQYTFVPKEEPFNEGSKGDTLSFTANDNTNKDSSNTNPENTTNPDSTNLESFENQITFKYYPNPTSGIINIEIDKQVEELFIADISGKVIFRLEGKSTDKILVNLSEYPSGTYFVMYQVMPDKWLKGKFLLLH